MAERISLDSSQWNDRLRTFALIMLVEDTLRPLYRYLTGDEIKERLPDLQRSFRSQVKQAKNDVEIPKEGDPLEYLPLTTLLGVHIGEKKPDAPKDEPLQDLFRPRSRAAGDFVSNLKVLVGIRNSVCHGRQVTSADFSTALRVGGKLLEQLDDVLEGYPVPTLGRPAEFVAAFVGSVSCCFQDQFELDGLKFCLVRDSRSPFAYQSEPMTYGQWAQFKNDPAPSTHFVDRAVPMKHVAGHVWILKEHAVPMLRKAYTDLSAASRCRLAMNKGADDGCDYCARSFPLQIQLEIPKLDRLRNKDKLKDSEAPAPR